MSLDCWASAERGSSRTKCRRCRSVAFGRAVVAVAAAQLSDAEPGDGERDRHADVRVNMRCALAEMRNETSTAAFHENSK